MEVGDYASMLRRDTDKFPTESDVQKALEKSYGWKEGHTPKVADFNLDRATVEGRAKA